MNDKYFDDRVIKPLVTKRSFVVVGFHVLVMMNFCQGIFPFF